MPNSGSPFGSSSRPASMLNSGSPFGFSPRPASFALPSQLSPFINHVEKTLHAEALKEIETLLMDMHASLLAILGTKVGYMALRQQAYMTQLRYEVDDLKRRVTDQKMALSEFEKKAMLMDNEVKLKEETIQKLQDNLSKAEARIKELECEVVESEEMNKRKVKELEEKNTKAINELESLKSSTDETIETEVAQQLNACVGQIEHKYPDLDLSWVYEMGAS